MSDYVVRIVQKRAPSEISYIVSEQDVKGFINRWRVENPDMLIHAQSMPLVAWSPSARIPVVYESVQYPPPWTVWTDEQCGDWPAPCNCDDPVTHDGHNNAKERP